MPVIALPGMRTRAVLAGNGPIQTNQVLEVGRMRMARHYLVRRMPVLEKEPVKHMYEVQYLHKSGEWRPDSAHRTLKCAVLTMLETRACVGAMLWIVDPDGSPPLATWPRDPALSLDAPNQ